MARGWYGSKEAHRAAALKGWITRRKNRGNPVPNERVVALRNEIAALEKQDEELTTKVDKLEQQGKYGAARKKLTNQIQIAGMRRLRLEDELKEALKSPAQLQQEQKRLAHTRQAETKAYERQKLREEKQQRKILIARGKDKNYGGFFVGDEERKVRQRINKENDERRQKEYYKKYGKKAR